MTAALPSVKPPVELFLFALDQALFEAPSMYSEWQTTSIVNQSYLSCLIFEELPNHFAYLSAESQGCE